MRLIEGTVEEIVEYQRRVEGAASPPAAVSGGEEVPVGAEPPAARTASGGLGDDEDGFYIRQYVYGRTYDAGTARRVLTFLERVATKGTLLEIGESERTSDGLTDYLMVRDDGPRRFGAVVYVRPANANLTFRLRPDDVEDLEDHRVRHRNVASGQQYAIRCQLVDDEAVELALELTDRALAKVRAE